MKFILLTILTFFCITHLFSQSKEELEIIQFHQKIYNGLLDDQETPNYLYPIVRSDSLIQLCEETQFESLAMQSLSWYYSYVGDHKKALQLYSNTLSPVALNTTQFISIEKYKPLSAHSYIAKESKKFDYLLLNEAHHKPVHRVFAISLLEGLKKQGYTTLAIEAIGKEGAIVNTTKIPDENLGGLTMEPNYSNLIREAIKMGFYILPYDYDSDFSFEKRDSVAALRIIEYQRNHQGKVFVFCGYEHVDQTQKSLAFWLEHFSEKEVLTIDQTEYTEEFDKKFESPYYQMAVDIYKESIPFILKKKKQVFNEKKTSDLFVFHPRTNYPNDREHWLTSYPAPTPRHQVKIPQNISYDITQTSLLQVFYKNEFPKGIPIDQFVINEQKDLNQFIIIPEGDFILTIENASRKRLLKKELSFSLAKGISVQ